MNQRTLIIDGHIWTGEEGGVLEDGSVVIVDGMVTSVAADGEIAVPGDADYMDFSGRWIIPGMIDAHTHLMFGGTGYRGYADYIREIRHLENGEDMALLRAVKNAQIHQAVGVTTLRDSGAVNSIVLSLRQGISRDYIAGPRILASGRPITITGGHFWWCNQEADGVDGVRRAVRQLHKEGADFIKIMASGGGTAGTDPRRASFSPEEMRAIVQEAHARGLKCSAHCEATAAVQRAVEAGVDTIEHAGFQEPVGTRTYRADLVQMMVQKDLSYCPTIPTAYRALCRYHNSGDNPAADRSDRLRAARYKLRRKLENLSRMLDAGVTVVAGTDSIREFGDYVVGLELFVYAGMTPEEALLSATSTAAGVLGIQDLTGSICCGRSADLIVVDGDPLSDISCLRRVEKIFQGGREVKISSHVSDALPDAAAPDHSSDIDSVLGR